MAKDTEYGTVSEGVSMAQEVTRKNKKNANVPGSGVYVHPESGQRAIVQSDPLWGNTQAQAFARLGFKFEREATADEVKTLPELAIKSTSANQDTLKGLAARLDAVENKSAEQADALASKTEENKALSEEVAALREQLAEAKKAQTAEAKADAKAQKAAAKEDAANKEHVEQAGASQVSDAQEASANDAKAAAEAQVEGREAASGSTNTKVTGNEGK